MYFFHSKNNLAAIGRAYISYDLFRMKKGFVPAKVRSYTLQRQHLHLWLAAAQWERMSGRISRDVQKWECVSPNSTHSTDLSVKLFHRGRPELFQQKKKKKNTKKNDGHGRKKRMKMGLGNNGSVWINCLGTTYFCYLSPFNDFFFFFSILSASLLSSLHCAIGHSASFAFSHATSRQQQKPARPRANDHHLQTDCGLPNTDGGAALGKPALLATNAVWYTAA